MARGLVYLITFIFGANALGLAGAYWDVEARSAALSASRAAAWCSALPTAHPFANMPHPVTPNAPQAGLTIQLLLFPDSLRDQGGPRKQAPKLPKVLHGLWGVCCVASSAGVEVWRWPAVLSFPSGSLAAPLHRKLQLMCYAPTQPPAPTPSHAQVSVTDSVFDLRKAFEEAERLGQAQAQKEIQRSMASRDDDGSEQPAGKK